MSGVELRNDDPSPHWIRIEGIAADGIASVGVLDKDGSIAARIPVIDNIYVAESLPSDANGPLVALDSGSNVIAEVP
jgi:hypothetical protein